jgi:hypothetical protein
MNAYLATLTRSDDRVDALAAELTEVAFPIALQHGTADNWVDFKLDLWRALRGAVKKTRRDLCDGRSEL